MIIKTVSFQAFIKIICLINYFDIEIISILHIRREINLFL